MAATQAAAPKRWQLMNELESIRAKALGVLRGKKKKLSDPWQHFGALKSLQRFEHKTEYLEAKVAICVTGRIRPKVAFRTLKKLRKHLERNGELARFDKFCDEIDAHLAPAMLTQHGYDQKGLGSVEQGKLWKEIDRVTKVLGKHDYSCFLNSGTLLGVTREGGLIDHDDDVDLAVMLRARSQKGAAKEWAELGRTLDEAGLLLEEAANLEILKIRTKLGVVIDLFPAWTQKSKVFVYPYSHGDLKSTDVLPLGKCKVSKHAIPAMPKRVLEVNYGKNWEMPDRLFRFGWAAANEKFADFLSDVREIRTPEKEVSRAKAA